MRFGYYAGFRDVGLPDGWTGAAWFTEPDAGYAFCNDGGVTVLVAMPSKARLDEFREDREAALLRMFARMPDGPDMSRAQRVSDVIGTNDYPSITRRRIVAPGVALVGDAAMVGDPLWGTGCGWAMQSAEWLSDAVAGPLRSGDGRAWTGPHAAISGGIVGNCYATRSSPSNSAVDPGSTRSNAWRTAPRRGIRRSPTGSPRWAIAPAHRFVAEPGGVGAGRGRHAQTDGRAVTRTAAALLRDTAAQPRACGPLRPPGRPR